MTITLILASQSPSRQQVLLNAGIRPIIRVSHVDEDEVIRQAAKDRGIDESALSIEDRVQLLARAKAMAVVRAYRGVIDTAGSATGDCVVGRPLDAVVHSRNPESVEDVRSDITRDFSNVAIPKTTESIRSSVSDGYGRITGLMSHETGPLVIGCDSMFLLDGKPLGKPHSEQVARDRIRALSGRSGELYTGHCIVNMATREVVQGVSRAVVRFVAMSDEEINAYVATGEPLEVAGSFTLEGIGGAFIESIDGDPSGIIGLSLPLARRLVRELGIEWNDLWNAVPSLQDANPDADPASTVPPRENVHQPGDGWVDCHCGRRHWGLNGAAGVLLARRDPATGLVTDVVMQHRAAWSAEGGTWGIPGGAIADGENAIEGALRESFEEANITPEDIEVVGSYREDHGNWAYTTVFAFEKPGHPVIPSANDDESMEVSWVPIDAVPDRRLLTAVRTDWPNFRARLEELAAQHADDFGTVSAN